jgi:hypothetical protein
MWMLISPDESDDQDLQWHERVNHRERESQSSPSLSSQSGRSYRGTESTNSSEIDVEDSYSSRSSLDEASVDSLDHDDDHQIHDEQPFLPTPNSSQSQMLDLDASANATAFEKLNLINNTKPKPADLIIILDGQKLHYVSAQDRFWRLDETTKLKTWLCETIYEKGGHLFKMLRIQPGFQLEDSDLPVTVDICEKRNDDLLYSARRSGGAEKGHHHHHQTAEAAKQVLADAFQWLEKFDAERVIEEEETEKEYQVRSVTDDVEAFDEAADERGEETAATSSTVRKATILARPVKKKGNESSSRSSSRTSRLTTRRGTATRQLQPDHPHQGPRKRGNKRHQPPSTHWSSSTPSTDHFPPDPDNNTYGREYQPYSPPKYRAVARGQGRPRPRQSNEGRDARHYHEQQMGQQNNQPSSDFSVSRSGAGYHVTPRRLTRRAFNGYRLPAIKNQSQSARNYENSPNSKRSTTHHPQQWRDEHHCWYERDGTSAYAADAANREAGTASGFEQQQAHTTCPTTTNTYTRRGRGHGRGRQTPTSSTNTYRSNRFQRQISYSHYDY